MRRVVLRRSNDKERRNHPHPRAPICNCQAHWPNSSQEQAFLAYLVREVTDKAGQIVGTENVSKTPACKWDLNTLLIADNQVLKNGQRLWRRCYELLKVGQRVNRNHPGLGSSLGWPIVLQQRQIWSLFLGNFCIGHVQKGPSWSEICCEFLCQMLLQTPAVLQLLKKSERRRSWQKHCDMNCRMLCMQSPECITYTYVS